MVRIKIKRFFIFSLVAFLVSSLVADEKPLASKRLIQALEEEVSGEIAFNYTVLISHFDRIQASEGWRDAALMIKKESCKYSNKSIHSKAILQGLYPYIQSFLTPF